MKIARFFWRLLRGVCLALGVLVVAFGIMAAIGFWRASPPALPDEMVLRVDLRDGVTEYETHHPLDYFLGRRPLSTRQAVMAIFDAAMDPSVLALVIRADDADIGLAQAQELRDAVLYFRSFDKPVYAFGDSFGMEGGENSNGYLVASAADQIWLQPSGDWALLGFVWELPYAAALLQRLGIKPEFATREEFKTAMSSFTDTAMSAPERALITTLGQMVLQQKTAAVAEARNLDPALSQLWIDESPLSATDALAMGLVTHLGYAQELAEQLLQRYGADTPWLDIADYAAYAAPDSDTQVAVVHIHGPIERGHNDQAEWSGEYTAQADTIASAIADAADAPTIRAIVLRIDSPGGSYVASDTIWHAVKMAKKQGKPVYAVFGNVAASGGYFVAMGADKIFASPGTITGSIGVVAGKFSVSELLQKLGIGIDGVVLGKNAALWSPTAGFTPQGRAKLEEFADRAYQDFLQKAAQGRGIPIAEMRDLAKGQIWLGEQAFANGLIDGTGGWIEAEDSLYQELGLADGQRIAYVAFPQADNEWAGLVNEFVGYYSGVRLNPLADLWTRITAPTIGTQARLWLPLAQQ